MCLTSKKKRKKKRGFAILGVIATGVTIAVGVSGKAGGQIVEPENGIRPPPDNRIRDCIDAGGVWKEQFQLCEFPEVPPSNGNGNGPPPLPIECPPGTHRNEFGLCVPNVPIPPIGCGPMPPVPIGQPGNGYLIVEPLGVRQVQWFEQIKFRAPSSIVLGFGGFSAELLVWYQCKVDSGELP